jgi:sigma54-dependent transcription regulator
LIFLLLATAAGAVYVFLHARRFLREMKSVRAAMDGPVQELEQSVERLSTKMESAEAAAPKLEASVERLRRSVARLTVLRTALQDSIDSFSWLTAVYPRK